jgi:integral membrane protein (TIGR01906 family)
MILRTAALAVGLALAGLIGLVAIFDGPDVYRDIARSSGITEAVFHAPPDLVWHTDLTGLVILHQRTLAYVLGEAPELPRLASTASPLFDDNERAHMADVRAVFGVTRVAFAAGVLILIVVLRTTERTRRVRLVRDAAVASGIGVALIAAVAAVAFEPVFLLFHQVFFPQGNFLFGPDSNLLVLYPEGYWYGVTLRIGITFAVATALVAVVATVTPRRAPRLDSRT